MIPYKRWLKGYRQLPVLHQFLLALAAFVTLAISVAAAFKKGPGGDFHVFWEAGRNFWFGKVLYADTGGRQFLYPPFSAFLFGFLGVWPFQVAALAHAVINAILVFTLIGLTYEIGRPLDFQTSRIWLMIAAILTIPYFLGNLQLLQMNLVLGFLLLGFLYSYLKGKDPLAGTLLAGAVAFKVTPVIWLGWLLVRGRWRVLGWSIGMLVLFWIGPWLIRGPLLGLQDMIGFYQTLQGKLPEVSQVTSFTNNKSLTGLLINVQHLTGNSLPPYVIQLAPPLLGVGFMGWLLSRQKAQKYVDILEWAVTLLVMLLVSSVTRTAHMATLVMVFYALLGDGVEKRYNWQQGGVLLIGVLLLLTGRDIVGDAAFEWLVHIVNIKTLGLIALLIIAYLKSREKPKESLLKN